MSRWKSSIIRALFWGILVGFTHEALSQGNPFPCDGRFFIAGTPSNGASSIILSAFPDDIGPTLAWDTVVVTSTHHIGPIGYSVLDNHIYALDTASFEILKIDAAGGIDILGSIKDKIDTSFVFHAGCVTPEGRKFSLIGRSSVENTDKVLYNVRLDDDTLRVGLNSLVTQGQLLLNDLAYDPHFGVLYGFDQANRKLVQLSGGLATGFNFQSTDPGVLMNGLFFGRDGQLYGYGRSQGSNGTDNTLFSISKKTGIVTALKSVLRSQRSDACACPHEIVLDRSFSPLEALPCDTVELIYTITNHSGFIYRNISLKDVLPPELELIDVIRQPLGTTISPLSEDSLTIFFANLDLRNDSIVFSAVLKPGTSAVGTFQPATLDSFPLGLGERIFSRESLKSRLSVTNLEVRLNGSLTACFGEDIELIPEVTGTSGALTYQWSDNSEAPTLAVTQSGSYSVTVSNGCLSGMDSIEVTIPDAPLSISLQDEVNINEGNGFLLGVLTNGTPPFRFSWSAPVEARLSCTTCASPIAKPLENVTVQVAVTDAFGCTATDSIRLIVDKIRDIQAPNVFTPNQDGTHDEFFLSGEANAVITSFQVFDRWGRMVFERNSTGLNDPATGWDGTFGSQPAKEGVYFWAAEVRYADESRERFRGNVTLVR